RGMAYHDAAAIAALGNSARLTAACGRVSRAQRIPGEIEEFVPRWRVGRSAAELDLQLLGATPGRKCNSIWEDLVLACGTRRVESDGSSARGRRQLERVRRRVDRVIGGAAGQSADRHGDEVIARVL